MQLRAKQMKALSNAAEQSFESRMVLHLRQFFPEQCKSLGEDGVRGQIHDGISAAATYDLVAERDVCKYIDVMFTIGWHFDQDPQIPWAREILTDDSVEDPTTRIENLCEAVELAAASPTAVED